MQSGGETGHHSRDFNTFIRTNKTGGGGGETRVLLCFDWTMLIGIQIRPNVMKNDLMLQNDTQ